MGQLELFTSHASVRSFEDKKIPADLKDELITAAQSGSSSNFVQAYSIIEIRDMEKLKEIEEISGCKGYVVNSGVFYIFVADLNRNYQVAKKENKDFGSFHSMESLMVAMVDTVIAAQNMAVFAESKGLGICYIGGIRNNMFRMAELLKLPSLTVPLFGLTIGYPKERNGVKPRLVKEEIVHIDEYGILDENNLKRYDAITRDYYQDREGNSQATDWSEKIQKHFAINRRPDILDFLKKQKFLISDTLNDKS